MDNGRTGKYEVVIPCNTLAKAQEIAAIAEAMQRFKNVKITSQRPILFYKMVINRCMRFYRVWKTRCNQAIQVILPDEVNQYWKRGKNYEDSQSKV